MWYIYPQLSPLHLNLQWFSSYNSDSKRVISPPDRHIDDDEQQQRQRRHSTAHDQRHGRELCLIHVLKKEKKKKKKQHRPSDQSLCITASVSTVEWMEMFEWKISNASVKSQNGNWESFADVWCVQSLKGAVSRWIQKQREIPRWLHLLRAHLLTGSFMVQMQRATFSILTVSSLSDTKLSRISKQPTVGKTNQKKKKPVCLFSSIMCVQKHNRCMEAIWFIFTKAETAT